MITQEDEKIRKRWLQVTLFSWLVLPFLGFLAFTHYDSFLQNNISLLLFFAIYACATFLPLYLLYHCAYKKYGNKLLICCLICGPFRMLYGIRQEVGNGWLLGCLIVEIITYVTWYVLSLKLIKINRAIQSQGQTSPEHAASLVLIKEAANLEDLESIFSEMIQRWPQFEPISSRAYKEKKALLHKS